MSESLTPLVVFCPLPPSPNGIADYFAEQIPFLSKYFTITVVVENAHPPTCALPDDVVVLRLQQYLAKRPSFSDIRHLYHVGNNADTEYLLPVLLSTPGVVVLHDLNLHHVMTLSTLNKGNRKGYTASLFNQYGRLGKLLGEQLIDFEWKGSFMPEELDFNGAVIDSAAHLICHSFYSSAKIQARKNNSVSVIPHHVSPLLAHYSSSQKHECRDSLALPISKTVITSLGFIAKSKQIPVVLKVLGNLKRTGLDFFYVLAGQCDFTFYDVNKDIRENNLQENVVVTGFLTEAQFFQHVVSSDIVVNLRYPSAGESSGTLSRAMGLGKCCIVSDVGSFSELPDNTVIKCFHDEHFAEQLQNKLALLINQSDERQALGDAAKEYTKVNQAIERTCEMYRDVIISSRTPGKLKATHFSPQLMQTVRIYHANVKAGWPSQHIPIEHHDITSLLALDLESTALDALQEAGYTQSSLTLASLGDIISAPTKIFDTADIIVMQLQAERLFDDPVFVLSHLSSQLRLDGLLIMLLSFDVERGGENNMQITPESFQAFMCASGMDVIDLCLSEESENHHCWQIKAKVVSRMLDRFPRPYYPVVASEAVLITRESIQSLQPYRMVDYSAGPL